MFRMQIELACHAHVRVGMRLQANMPTSADLRGHGTRSFRILNINSRAILAPRDERIGGEGARSARPEWPGYIDLLSIFAKSWFPVLLISRTGSQSFL